MRFAEVSLRASAAHLPALASFYAERLGLLGVEWDASSVAVPIGETRLVFVAADGEPFYHFALLAPGDRFDAAYVWARGVTDLLSEENGDAVFEFDFWDARALYFHDPAGNIVEVISHRSLADSGSVGAFAASELLGLSELGLVGDPRALASTLETELGLDLWDGTRSEPGRLAFVGEKGRTLILSPAGRPWLPTGRPAEPHAAEVVIADAAGDARLEEHGYRIRGTETLGHSADL